MNQVYLDTIILRVIENAGNDPTLRADFLRRVLRERLKDVVPKSFFPICMEDVDVKNGIAFLQNEFLDVIAATKQRPAPQMLCIMENQIFDPQGIVSRDYITEADVYAMTPLTGDFDMTVDVMSKKIAIYTEEPKVSVFYYSPYRDKNGRIVVPEFAANYLEQYGTMRALEVSLTRGLRGKTPGMVPQTRYTVNEIKVRVTRAYLSMQTEISLMLDKIVLKPVNSEIDATI